LDSDFRLSLLLGVAFLEGVIGFLDEPTLGLKKLCNVTADLDFLFLSFLKFF
jgi:hypothetical protein